MEVLDKKKYIYNVLGNKSELFINENFQYTLDLFDKETNDEPIIEENKYIASEMDDPSEEQIEEQCKEIVVNDTTLNQMLIDTHNAVAYFGQSKDAIEEEHLKNRELVSVENDTNI